MVLDKDDFHVHLGHLLEKRCSKCRTWNPADHEFCDECGTTLKEKKTKTCRYCNESNRLTAHYCGKCGKPFESKES